MPLNDEFLSGAHRGRFNPKDGQLYVSGMGGWGTYTPHDASFQRVRYTGDPVQLPVAFHAHQNGVLLTFTRPLDPAVAELDEVALRPGVELPLLRLVRLARILLQPPRARPVTTR